MHSTPIMQCAVLVFGMFATATSPAGAEETAKQIDVTYVYGDGKTPVNEEHRTWTNAAGWGGMPTIVGKSNTYNSSANLPGDQPLQVTFPIPATSISHHSPSTM